MRKLLIKIGLINPRKISGVLLCRIMGNTISKYDLPEYLDNPKIQITSVSICKNEDLRSYDYDNIKYVALISYTKEIE